MSATSSKRRRWLAGTAAVLVLVTGGIITAIELTSSAGPEASADTHVTTAGLPDMPADTRQAYEAAPTHADLFAHLPCYCGCVYLDVPHASLERCFLLPDGSFEIHASGCKICTDIAIDALVMDGQGLDHTAIRAAIDAKYVRAGPPTDTPLP